MTIKDKKTGVEESLWQVEINHLLPQTFILKFPLDPIPNLSQLICPEFYSNIAVSFNPAIQTNLIKHLLKIGDIFADPSVKVPIKRHQHHDH